MLLHTILYMAAPNSCYHVTEYKYKYLVHDYSCIIKYSLLAKNVSTTSFSYILWKSKLLAKLMRGYFFMNLRGVIDKFVSFFSIGSLFTGGFTSFSVIINNNLSLIGRKH